MRIFSYAVARDFGFAPNPFYGYCTLGTCKPVVRRVAKVGDIVLGTGSKALGSEGYLIYAMRVTEVMTFNSYWDDPRFQIKKPNLSGSVKKTVRRQYLPQRKEWLGTIGQPPQLEERLSQSEKY